MLNKIYIAVGAAVSLWFAAAAFGQWKAPNLGLLEGGSGGGRGTGFFYGGWGGGK